VNLNFKEENHEKPEVRTSEVPYFIEVECNGWLFNDVESTLKNIGSVRKKKQYRYLLSSASNS